LPQTRAEVSSLATTELWRTVLAIDAALAANGFAARASMLAMAPSDSFNPNKPSSTSVMRL
jgi:hypothetical protein